MATRQEYHYTYYSYEEWGRGYFGSRTCKCLPKEDIKYFGSFRDNTFNPTQKIILKDDYDTREEAYADEIILQEYYKVVENPHFANRAYQTSIGFSTQGTKHSNERLLQLKERFSGINNPMYGKTHSHLVKQKLSNMMKNNNPMKNSEFVSKWKISNSGKNHRLYGKTRSQQEKDKLSISSCKYFYEVISPNGNIFYIRNMKKFCIENKLDDGAMGKIANGKAKHHKKWKCKKISKDEFNTFSVSA
jgi:hypothetical protein